MFLNSRRLYTLPFGAPTAASGAFSSLRWLEDHLGLCFHTRSPTVTAWEACRARPRGKAKGALISCPCARIESYALGAAGPRRVSLVAWLVVSGGVLRFAHLQRSQLSLMPGVLAGKASLAKVNVRGARRPLAWRVSTLELTGYLLAAGPPAGPHGRELGLPRAGAGVDVASRLLFQEMGWTEEGSSALTTYSARRVLPSVADAPGLSASDCGLGRLGWLAFCLVSGCLCEAAPNADAVLRRSSGDGRRRQGARYSSWAV